MKWNNKGLMTGLIYFSACVHLAILMSNEYLPVQLYPVSILCFVCDACSARRAHFHFWAESVPPHLRTVLILTSVLRWVSIGWVKGGTLAALIVISDSWTNDCSRRRRTECVRRHKFINVQSISFINCM